MPIAEVIKLHDAPLLTDISGMMRRMADQIEAGEYGEITTAYLVVPERDVLPRLFGWGNVDGKNDPIIQLELCRMWLLNNITERT